VPDQTAPTIQVRQISVVECREILMAGQVVTASPYRNGEEFASQACAAGSLLPADVVSCIGRLRDDEGSAALLLRGLSAPLTLPQTPLVPYDRLAMDGTRTEGVLAALAACAGQPFAFREWDSGHLVQNRYPVPAHEKIQAASGAAELVVHTEASFARVSPDFLALLCLRADPDGAAKTTVADIGKTIGDLGASVRECLAQPCYAFETDNYDCIIDGRALTRPVPVLKEWNGRHFVEFSNSLTAVTADSAKALATLAEALALNAVSVALQPGDLLVLNNRRVVHGRTAFQPRYDGTDRWIQRILLLSELPRGSGRLVSDSRFASYPTSYLRTLRSHS
jgi:L-asparagine oxygenase